MSEQLDITKPKPAKARPLTEAELIDRLRTRYAAPAYALLSHVRNQTGFGPRTRTADAIAMSLWPSRGLAITGFEIKSSRSDWLSELAAPAKAEEIARHCDEWILVVGDRDIVRPGELPLSWGLMAPKGDGLVMVTEPKPIEERSKAVDRKFLAAILRNAHESSPTEVTIKAACDKVRTECYQAEVQKRERDKQNIEYRVKELEQRIAEFESASGITIDKWNGGHIGRAVKVLRGNTAEDYAIRLGRIAKDLEDLSTAARTAASAIAETQPEAQPWRAESA